MTFGNVSKVAFNKQTKALWLQMGLVLVLKKVLLRFDSLTTREHSISLSWITVSIIQNLQLIFSPWDISQRNFSMQMEIRMKRLVSSLESRLMFLPGLSGSSRRHFPLQCLVYQIFFLTKAFKHTSHFECKLTLLMQMQSWTWHLKQVTNLQMLSLMKIKNLLLVLLTIMTTMQSTCYVCFMRSSFWKIATELHEKLRTLALSFQKRFFSTKFDIERSTNFLLMALFYLTWMLPKLALFQYLMNNRQMSFKN